jgi:hypothetical protein
VSGLLPKEGWCFTRPLQAPTHCRWCGKALKILCERHVDLEQDDDDDDDDDDWDDDDDD